MGKIGLHEPRGVDVLGRPYGLHLGGRLLQAREVWATIVCAVVLQKSCLGEEGCPAVVGANLVVDRAAQLHEVVAGSEHGDQPRVPHPFKENQGPLLAVFASIQGIRRFL